MQKLIEVINRKLEVNLHEGQEKAWDSEKRFVFVLAGTQGGKTDFGVIWLLREIDNKGDGDYLVVSPSFPLQDKKVVPSYRSLLEDKLNLGEYKDGKKQLILNKRGYNSTIFFGSADNPNSLESCTAKAAHLDEVGQSSFKLASWEAVIRRLSIHQGRILGTTTIYNLGWMKNEIYDRWKKGDIDIDVIQFESIMNPAFPKAEYERAKKTLPSWKFNMFYRGIYDKPAGMIYDSFDSDLCKIKPISLDKTWKRYLGIDFGGVHTAIVWIAEHVVNDNVTNYYIYREYLEGGKTAKDHVESVNSVSKGENIVKSVGGSWSEDQWRDEWTQAGLFVRKAPIKDVELGITKTYGLFKQNRVFIFDTCKGILEEINNYSRVLDPNGEPTEKIEDKEKYHRLDAVRYIFSDLVRDSGPVVLDDHRNVKRERTRLRLGL